MKKILIVFFSILIIIEIVILHTDNKTLILSNNKIEEELRQNNLIVDNKVSLDSIYKEKEETNEKVQELFSDTAFKVDDIKQMISDEEETGKTLKEDISSLEEEIVGLENNITTLESEYKRLAKEYEEKNSTYISGVPTINQYPDYPTGCESVALTILLKYYGISVSTDDIINKLDKGSTPYTKGDVIYGGNPELEFIGDPRSQNSFGVYEKPIAKVANTYKPGIKIATGTSFDDILKIVKSGRPVMVWTSMNLSVPYISRTWIYEPTGESVYWKAGEHAVVIMGYTPDKVIISDPIGGKVKYQSLSVFRERYNYFGKKALYY